MYPFSTAEGVIAVKDERTRKVTTRVKRVTRVGGFFNLIILVDILIITVHRSDNI
jgi:hypothetical protein